MKKILFNLLCCFFVTNIYGQFYGGEDVYCYQYQYTNNDGIKSKKQQVIYCFVNFQKDMMEFYKEIDVKRIRKNLLENSFYYEDAVRDKLAKNYSNWKRGATMEDINPFWGNTTVALYKYNEEFSTYSKYTYRRYVKTAWSNQFPYAQWGKPHWSVDCYTFSKDRSEMIIWKTNDPENRDYFKLIDVSDLKPNTDFLY